MLFLSIVRALLSRMPCLFRVVQRNTVRVSVVNVCDFVGEIWELIASYEIDMCDRVLNVRLEKILFDTEAPEDLQDWDYVLKNPPLNSAASLEVEIECAGFSEPIVFTKNLGLKPRPYRTALC